ncbi:uncharacterized protein LOC115229389 [Octopus sinensis]|uniref:Uncharacterized protein LOC115229389 n=1 Tax=Octopus sinensis TaxID=2607531 RepID=A0A6P7U278_9MOLL|nr:uncharacterized protein LOC115229389 [Octopus sinensis]
MDILVVNETKLKGNQHHKIHGFQSIDIPWRPDAVAGTGTSIYYKDNLMVRDLKIVEQNLCELITLKLLTSLGWISVGAMYSKAMKNYQNLIEEFFQNNDRGILIGDLNAKHTSYGCANTNSDGNILLRLSENCGFSVLTSREPNHFSCYGEDCIGVFLVSADLVHQCSIPRIEINIGSDHLPQSLCMRTSSTICEDLFIGYDTSRTIWSDLEVSMKKHLTPYPIQSIPSNIQIEKLNKILREAILDFLRKSSIRKYIMSNTNRKTRIDESLGKLIKWKGNLEKKLRRCSDPIDRIRLRDKIRTVKIEINDVAKKHSDLAWKSQCSKLNKKNPHFWKVFNRLSNMENKGEEIRLKTTEGIDIPLDEVPSHLRSQLAKVQEVDPIDMVPKEVICEAQRSLRANLSHTGPLCRDITLEETYAAIMSCKNNAPGHDYIPISVFKHAPNILLRYLTALYNASWRLGYVPDS